MTSIAKRVCVVGLAWLLLGTGAPALEPISQEQFARLQDLIKPGADEDCWANIPWLTDLWQARKVAALVGAQP